MRRIVFGVLIVLACGWVGSALAQDDPPQEPTGKIVFLSQRSGNAEIWSIDLETSELAQLTDRTHIDWAPEWTPDGQQIVFHAQDPDTKNWELWIMDADGTDPHRDLQFRDPNFECSVGRRIAIELFGDADEAAAAAAAEDKSGGGATKSKKK